MSTPARKRLMRDFKRLQTDPPQGVNGTPCPDNIMLWNAVIFGPEDTPWDGGTFRLTMQFSEEYPNKPPVVKFKSTMFHPNIYADGAICLDILQNQWSPIYDVSAVLTSVQSLLCDPNPTSPANSEAARLYGEDKREYNRRVREVVEASLMHEEGGGAGAGTSGGAGAGAGGGKKRAAADGDSGAGGAAAAAGGAAAPPVKKEKKEEPEVKKEADDKVKKEEGAGGAAAAAAAEPPAAAAGAAGAGAAAAAVKAEAK